jgi:phenol hydroxylase P5 protein
MSTSSGERRLYEGRVARIVQRAPDTRSYFLALPNRKGFKYKPGQFISCQLPVDGETLTRPYSVASNPEDEELEICLNLVPGGRGSAYLFGLTLGDTVHFTGPWGTFCLEEVPDTPCVFVAEGTGIAPIRPMITRALATAGTHAIALHYAAGGPQQLLYAGEFEQTAERHARFVFSSVLGGSLRTVIERTYVAADTDRSRHFFVCGVGSIVTELRDLLRGAGYERRAVHYEKW